MDDNTTLGFSTDSLTRRVARTGALQRLGLGSARSGRAAFGQV
ncbi:MULTISPECIES: hypothetical protein [Cupriavidus]|nr:MULTISPECIES: hypothetical protein [Cupriavidus]